MCCCCCPPAISALLCLWCQSGCSKGTVAGALTFFPPEPALYQYERHTKDGRILGDDEEADDETPKGRIQSGGGGEATTTSTALSGSVGGETHEDDDDDLEDVGGPDGLEPLEARTEGQTQEKMRSPMQQLTDQAAERRKRSKIRSARDARDAAAGVQYRLLLDSRLHVPRHQEELIEAVKVPCSKRRGTYIAAVTYRVPPHRRNSRTRTIIYSHGNATDVGAMFPVQVVLSHSLDCNVVSYDYSGYGESGSVPEEGNTYRDLEAVYEYTLKEVADGVKSNIILYGQSVGSGPCCYLAAKDDEIGGMVLHSPFTSVMVIHGRLDQEVDISHGVEMHRAVPRELRRDPWWVPDRGHNDITDGSGKLAEYLRRLRVFLNSLEDDE